MGPEGQTKRFVERQGRVVGGKFLQGQATVAVVGKPVALQSIHLGGPSHPRRTAAGPGGGGRLERLKLGVEVGTRKHPPGDREIAGTQHLRHQRLLRGERQHRRIALPDKSDRKSGVQHSFLIVPSEEAVKVGIFRRAAGRPF